MKLQSFGMLLSGSVLLCAVSSCGGKEGAELFNPSTPAGGSGGSPQDSGDDGDTPDAQYMDTVSPPPQDAACGQLSESCANGVACCAGGTCNQPGALCGSAPCPNYGAPCQSKSDCCLPLNCSDQGFCYSGPEACGHVNVSCSQSTDCCNAEGLQCLGGSCQPGPACMPGGQSCDSSSPPCCAPLTCLSNGQCGTPTACNFPGSACNVCIGNNCCNEFQACQTDPACTDAMSCATHCGNDQGCVQTCMSQHPSTVTNQLITCAGTKCYTECAG